MNCSIERSYLENGWNEVAGQVAPFAKYRFLSSWRMRIASTLAIAFVPAFLAHLQASLWEPIRPPEAVLPSGPATIGVKYVGLAAVGSNADAKEVMKVLEHSGIDVGVDTGIVDLLVVPANQHPRALSLAVALAKLKGIRLMY